MKRPDHNTYREWLNLEVDGQLPPSRRAELGEHLAGCAECRAEREDLLALGALLQKNRVSVRASFKDDVLAALPTTGWENRHPKTWAFPAAVFVLLAGIAAALFGSARLSEAGPGASALLAMADMLGSTVQAGAGLLAATWKGLGMAVGEVIASPVSLGVLAVLVISLNLLLFSLLRRRRAAGAAVRGRR
ncbi:MAG TPA: zf-HC2 domain-containing protein [Thermoanaerobaculia bacterium]|nr:zf-HC2 domain-containing protein [Thermoanaerobaculia bacterium]